MAMWSTGAAQKNPGADPEMEWREPEAENEQWRPGPGPSAHSGRGRPQKPGAPQGVRAPVEERSEGTAVEEATGQRTERSRTTTVKAYGARALLGFLALALVSPGKPWRMRGGANPFLGRQCPVGDGALEGWRKVRPGRTVDLQGWDRARGGMKGSGRQLPLRSDVKSDGGACRNSPGL